MKQLIPKPDFIYHSKGGSMMRRHTIVGIIQDKELKIGYAVCNRNDQFSKKLGICIATGRAIKVPTKTIQLLERPKYEIKILFKDISDNFGRTNSDLVIPKY